MSEEEETVMSTDPTNLSAGPRLSNDIMRTALAGSTAIVTIPRKRTVLGPDLAAAIRMMPATIDYLRQADLEGRRQLVWILDKGCQVECRADVDVVREALSGTSGDSRAWLESQGIIFISKASKAADFFSAIRQENWHTVDAITAFPQAASGHSIHYFGHGDPADGWRDSAAGWPLDLVPEICNQVSRLSL
jgi:hypothetical protein